MLLTAGINDSYFDFATIAKEAFPSKNLQSQPTKVSINWVNAPCATPDLTISKGGVPRLDAPLK